LHISPPKQAKFLAEDAPYYVAQLSKARVLSRQKTLSCVTISQLLISWLIPISCLQICKANAGRFTTETTAGQQPKLYPFFLSTLKEFCCSITSQRQHNSV
jgi:hypothetical protein